MARKSHKTKEGFSPPMTASFSGVVRQSSGLSSALWFIKKFTISTLPLAAASHSGVDPSTLRALT